MPKKRFCVVFGPIIHQCGPCQHKENRHRPIANNLNGEALQPKRMSGCRYARCHCNAGKSRKSMPEYSKHRNIRPVSPLKSPRFLTQSRYTAQSILCSIDPVNPAGASRLFPEQLFQIGDGHVHPHGNFLHRQAGGKEPADHHGHRFAYFDHVTVQVIKPDDPLPPSCAR